MRSINGRTVSQIMMGVLACLFVGLGIVYPNLNAIGAYNFPPPPPPRMDTPPPPPPPPPHFTPPPPPPHVFTPPGAVVSTDITSNTPFFNPLGPGSSEGLVLMSTGKFPSASDLGGSTDFILVLPKDANTIFGKISQYAVSLKEGQLLVGVRKPSNTGMVVTDNVEIALFSNAQGADALVTMKDGVIRVANLDGLGDNVRILLKGPQFEALKNKVFALKPGFELVASGTPLTRKDIRPPDGIGRRQTQLIETRHVAISQFSVESALKNSDLVANLAQKDSGSKERRILADMSKMAAVLNQVGGTWGYEGDKKP